MDKNPHDQSRMILRRLLREQREGKSWRQQDLADRLEKPQSYVSKYESGERRLDVLELREICLALGISLAAFAEKLEKALRPQRSR
jgi:transcriptional regulator with XRE-family HTH domain